MTTTPDERPGHQPGGATQGGGEAVEADLLERAAEVVDDVAERELAPEDVAAFDELDAPRRLMLVHAHPDDETIGNGVTMARYAAEGASVTLVTCTRGELGEIVPPDLQHLTPDELAERRTHELAAAMEALGVTDHRILGADAGARYRDSGMVWGPDGRAAPPPDMRPDAFAAAGLDEAAAHLVRVIREVRPQVVVTYEPGGGYGHPDHVMAHRTAVRAVELAADPAHGTGEPWEVAKLYWTVVPESFLRQGLREAAADNPFDGGTWDPDGPLPSVVVPDDQVTAVVDAPDQLGAKLAALRAHATQLEVRGTWMALSNGVGVPVSPVETYRLVRGRPAPPFDAHGRETDLLAGA